MQRFKVYAATLVALGLLLVGLKLAGVIVWSWFFVLVPFLIIVAAFALAVAAVGLLMWMVFK